MHLAINGTLMRGLALNANLVAVEATFVREATTAPCYRLWSIGDRYPAMVRVPQHRHTSAASIALEIWDISPAGLVVVLLQEPPGLTLGQVLLASGESVLGVLGEPWICEAEREITAYGGWRAYCAEGMDS